MKKIIIILASVVIFISDATALSEENKLLQLQAVINESKLLPTPEGIGGNAARFAESISIDGNRALIGSPVALEHGVAYIFDYDGSSWVETQVIFPDDINGENRFGGSVSLQGNRALIGDKFNRVNGAHQAGAVYVYDLNNGIWSLTQKLIASDLSSTDQFGGSVSLSGDRALIGAVNYDDVTNGSNSGAAYIFDYNGSIWQESAILTASGGSSSDNIGNSVSLDGDIALVGARNFDDNNNGINTGSAYLFERDSGTDIWSQSHQFLASDGADDDRYGIDVSLSSGRVLIGADQTDEGFNSSGSAYVYEHDGSIWVETKLLAEDAATGDRFGATVSIENNRLLVGAGNGEVVGVNTGSAYIYDYDSAMTQWNFTQEIAADDITTNSSFASSLALSADRVIVGNFQDSDNGSQSGAAYVFDLDVGTWQQSQKIITQGAVDDNFGYAVSMDGNRALIGAPFDGENGPTSGAAYIFDFINGQWSQPVKLLSSVTDSGFGASVSLSGNRALIGSNRVSAVDSGSAYIFDFDGTTWSETAILDSPLLSDEFGISVSLSGDRALVGASFDTGVTIQTGSVYVFDLIVDTWQQTDKLIDNDGVRFDGFGGSVSLLGDRALVGASQKDDVINSITRAGAAFIYDYDSANDVWLETKLQVPDPNANDFFGSSVDLDNNRAIVGARNGFGVSSQTGSAYIFDLDTVTDMWSSTKILASDGSSLDQFGGTVSIDGNQALVGAYLDFNNSIRTGSVYQYEFDGNAWNEVKKHVASDAANTDRYGWSVSLANGQALIGADRDDDRGTDSGSVYTINNVDSLFADGFEE